jgi:hypothetical protein
MELWCWIVLYVCSNLIKSCVRVFCKFLIVYISSLTLSTSNWKL